MNQSSPDCRGHPLSILCRCAEYKSIIDKFVPYTISTQHFTVPMFNIEPFASAKVSWVNNHLKLNQDVSKPTLDIPKSTDKIDSCTIKKKWIPVLPDLISPKELRSNYSYMHTAGRNTQSAEMSTLTDMLPHKGRVIKRRDIYWGIGSHSAPVEMTDEEETNFGRVKGCFSTWAEEYTIATGYLPY